MDEAVTVEQGDGVIVITINRPEARNAINGAVRTGITAAVAELDDRDDLAIGILIGAGANALAVAATKEIITSATDWTLDEGWDAQQPILAPVFASEDAREGARAFAEKRAPQWKGK